jgi:hypothetical protein
VDILSLPSWCALVQSNQKPKEEFLFSHAYYNLAMDLQLQQWSSKDLWIRYPCK